MFGLFSEYCVSLSYFLEKALLLFIFWGLRFLFSHNWRLFLLFLYIDYFLFFFFLAVDYRSINIFYLIFQILYFILINILPIFLHFLYSTFLFFFPLHPFFLSSLSSPPFSSFSISSIFIVLFKRSGIYKSRSAVTLFPSFSLYDWY